MNNLKVLSEAATQGEWVAALERGCHGVIAASLPLGGANFVALIGNDTETPENEPMRFANARLIAALVNAYRAGELVPADAQAEAAQKLDAIRASQCPAAKPRKGVVAGVEDEGETA